jgi:hypothetical protein
LRLTKFDVDFLRRNIHVCNTKNGKGRFIPINEIVRAILLDLVEKAGVKEFVGLWKGEVIGRNLLIAGGAGLFLYGAFNIFRLAYIPDLPPPDGCIRNRRIYFPRIE